MRLMVRVSCALEPGSQLPPSTSWITSFLPNLQGVIGPALCSCGVDVPTAVMDECAKCNWRSIAGRRGWQGFPDWTLVGFVG